MSNILFVNSSGESVHSCCESEGIPKEDDRIVINGNSYTVLSVEKIINNCSTSWKVTLR